MGWRTKRSFCKSRMIQKCNLIHLIHFDPFWTDLIQSHQKINKVKNLMIYFNDYFIRNPIWSSLIHFDPFQTDLIHSDQKINNIESLMMYFNDYLIRNWKMWKIWGKCRINELCDEKYWEVWWCISMIISSEIGKCGKFEESVG